MRPHDRRQAHAAAVERARLSRVVDPGDHDSPACIAILGALVLVGAGSDVLAVEHSGAVRRSIDGLRWCRGFSRRERRRVRTGTGTVALFDRGTATVWTGFTDPAAVALTADAVFVAEEASRQVVASPGNW